MKKVLFIATGGTISESVSCDGKLTVDSKKDINFILQNLLKREKVQGIKTIDTCNLFQIDSSNMSPEYWKKLINKIYDEYDNYDAFVICHGTDTLAYTCSALAFAFTNIAKPIILTGSQIPFGELGSDAEMNIENIIRVLSQDVIKLKGVMCLFSNKLISGTRVRKNSEFDYSAFESNNETPLAYMGVKIRFNIPKVEAHNKCYGLAKTKEEVVLCDKFALDKIMVIHEFPGLNVDIVKQMMDNGIKGIILKNYADGNSNVSRPDSDIPNINELYDYARKKNCIIAVSSQPYHGVTTMNNYETGILARELGGIPSYDISFECLTVKLAWLIGQKYHVNEIREKIVENIKDEIQFNYYINKK
ncbi:MAG: asparaginase [Clostridia bacterium]|nr:asparaginase [Clostridia bacterium]